MAAEFASPVTYFMLGSALLQFGLWVVDFPLIGFVAISIGYSFQNPIISLILRAPLKAYLNDCELQDDPLHAEFWDSVAYWVGGVVSLLVYTLICATWYAVSFLLGTILSNPVPTSLILLSMFCSWKFLSPLVPVKNSSFHVYATRVMIAINDTGLLIWRTCKGMRNNTLANTVLKLCTTILGSLCRIACWKSGFDDLPEFEYSSVPFTLGEIRVLRLRRRLPFLELEGELLSVPSGRGGYDCVSYTWGNNNTKTHRLRLNNARCIVTEQVHNVLTERSSYWTAVTIWIDALCINQSDDAIAERTHFVSMMRDIYSSANRVFVCLGSPPEARLAVAFHSTLSSMMKVREDGRLAYDGWRALILGKSELEYATLKAVLELLSHPWYSRVWVVQEVAVAKRVIVLFGGYWLSWNLLIEQFNMITSRQVKGLTDYIVCGSFLFASTDRPQPGLGFEGAQMMDQIRSTLQQKQDLELLDVLEQSRHFAATRPVDKLFALLPLTDAANSLSHLIDYAKDTEGILYEIGVYISQKTNVIQTLHHAGIGYGPCTRRAEHRRLPSWVVDWTVSCLRTPLAGTHENAETARYRTAVQKPAKTILLPMYKALRIYGVKIDVVRDLGPRCPVRAGRSSFHRYDAAALAEYVAYIGQVRKLVHNNVQNLYTKTTGEQKPEEVLSRLWIGDRTRLVRPAPPTYADYLDHFVEYLHLDAPDMVKSKVYEGTSIETLSSLLRDRTRWEGRNDPMQIDSMMDITPIFDLSSTPRRVASTNTGYIAAVPEYAQSGDLIVALFGADVPFVLRPTKGPDALEKPYILVGECYVHGAMDGEALEACQAEEWFDLI